MKYDYDLVIIGGGSAGMAAAEVAPRMGVRAALVERDLIGGDCLWTGCVPSKALIASARLAHRMRHADDLGLAPSDAPVDSGAVMERVRHVQEEIAAESDNTQHFEALGVTVLAGEARLLDEHTVAFGDRTLTARFILLATGSRPAVPPIEGLREAGFLTSETFFTLERLPASMLVIGGGPVAVEMAQAMQRLGTRVTLLEALPQILGREEPALSEQLHQILEREGVDVSVGVQISRVVCRDGGKVAVGATAGATREWAADAIFVATGRAPNIETLDLGAAGVVFTEKGVTVEKRLRTSTPSIYAAGDVAGRYLFTHSAVSEAATALRNMFYPGSMAAGSTVPWTTFTDPELGHAGVTSAEAKRILGDGSVLVFRESFADSDRARADGEEGEIVLITDTRYRLLGAHVLAPGAGDMMGAFADAIDRRARLTPDFAKMVQVYPTFAYSVTRAAGEATYRQLGRPFLRAMRRAGSVLHR